MTDMDTMATHWRVTQQQEGVGQNAQGQVVRGVTVHYQLDDGLGGSVFVPAGVFNAATVRSMVTAAARNAEEIAHLTGPAV